MKKNKVFGVLTFRGLIVSILLFTVSSFVFAADLAVVTENVLGCTDKKLAQLGGMSLLARHKDELVQLLVGKDAKCLLMKKGEKNVIEIQETRKFNIDKKLTQIFVKTRVLYLNGENIEEKNFVMWSMYPRFIMDNGETVGKIFYKKL